MTRGAIFPASQSSPRPVRVTTSTTGRPEVIYLGQSTWSVRTVHQQWTADPEECRTEAHYLVEVTQARLFHLLYRKVEQRWYRQPISQKAWRAQLPSPTPERPHPGPSPD